MSHTLALHAYVTLRGVRLHYVQAGETGAPLVLLHGGGLDSASLSWSQTWPALARSHRIFVPDLPGYGDSDRPFEFEHSIESYGRLLMDFLDAIGIAQAGFCGVSMGGALALHIGLNYPEQVLCLIPVASYGLQRRAPAHVMSYFFVRMPFLSRLIYVLLRRNRTWVRASLRPIFADPSRITNDLVNQAFAELSKPRVGEAFMDFQRREVLLGRLRTNFLTRLAQLRAPTLFVHGDQDALVPVAWAREAARRTPHALLREMKGCGHWPQRERSEEFNTIVADFLNR